MFFKLSGHFFMFFKLSFHLFMFLKLSVRLFMSPTLSSNLFVLSTASVLLNISTPSIYLLVISTIKTVVVLLFFFLQVFSQTRLSSQYSFCLLEQPLHYGSSLILFSFSNEHFFVCSRKETYFQPSKYIELHLHSQSSFMAVSTIHLLLQSVQSLSNV